MEIKTLTEWFESLSLMDKLFLRDTFLGEQKRFKQQIALQLHGDQVGGVDNVVS